MAFQLAGGAFSLEHMESSLDFHEMRAALQWQIDLGATEAIQDLPVNRYESAEKTAKSATDASRARGGPQATLNANPDSPDPVAVAKTTAAGANSLAELHAALQNFEHCELKRGARNCVFADGSPAARVMIIGEAPGRDEDIQGLPFVGRAGQLLDKMFAAIGLDRKSEQTKTALYITNILPWRPPQNRDPLPAEIAMMHPFVLRHMALAKPDLIVAMGNTPCQALLGKKGITRLRGNWSEVQGIPAMPMFHPAHLLRNPERKREAWADLLDIRARLDTMT